MKTTYLSGTEPGVKELGQAVGYTGRKMEITYTDQWKHGQHQLHPLYHRDHGDFEPLPAYIEIDPGVGELSAGVGQKSGTPIYVWHGRACRVGVSASLTRNEVVDLIDEVAPLAEIVARGYEEKWDGSNYVGKLDADAEGALSKIEQICDERETDSGGVWDAGNWFSDAPPHEITAKTTDDELEKIAEEYVKDAGRDNISLNFLEEYLTDMRERMQQEVAQ